MNVVFIIPTGIGCEIGGHAGDASPAVKLISSLADKFITHPNAVNASDINEMPENVLYVEGSILDRFLWGQVFLKEVPYNRVLLAVNKPVRNETINAVNAACVTLGAKIDIIELETPLTMHGKIINRRASGEVHGWDALVEQVNHYTFDALAIASPITVDRETRFHYFKNGGINPWGGIEAIASKLIADKLDKPVAHAPVQIYGLDDEYDRLHETLVSDPRMAPEMVSICYIHCVFKGLHRAPRINYDYGFSVDNVDVMVSPICYGEPHEACAKQGIPVIYVRENKTVTPYVLMKGSEVKREDFFVDNYLEAAGIISAMKAGVHPHTVRRPIESTRILSRCPA